jgi:hypothetical protein
MRTTNGAVLVVRLRLICEAPPTGVGIEFGLQDKDARLQPGVREPDGALRFEADVRVVVRQMGGSGFAARSSMGRRRLRSCISPVARPPRPWRRGSSG